MAVSEMDYMNRVGGGIKTQTYTKTTDSIGRISTDLSADSYVVIGGYETSIGGLFFVPTINATNEWILMVMQVNNNTYVPYANHSITGTYYYKERD